EPPHPHGRRGRRHLRQGPGQDGQGPARGPGQGPRLRRGPEHRQAPPEAHAVHGPAEVGGRRRGEGGPDPHLQRDAGRPAREEAHPCGRDPRERRAQPRHEALADEAGL
ncbi:MAG: LSU ribosomal protein L24p (L26e), partial [uncultured Solirubrobacteraceae bacterium]